MSNNAPKRIRSFRGKVVSAKTKKTLVVEVERFAEHPKYKKITVTHRRFHVHDPQEKFHEGDLVTFQACRPISRTKRWMAIYGENERKA